MTLKKYANQLAVSIIEKRGSEDSNIWEDVETYFAHNPRIFTLVDNSIGGEVFENWVRDKLELLYKIEYNILPYFRKQKKVA
jgi:hypothetical protein